MWILLPYTGAIVFQGAGFWAMLLKLNVSSRQITDAEGFHTIQEQSWRLPYYSRTKLQASILRVDQQSRRLPYYSRTMLQASILRIDQQSRRLPYYRTDETKQMASIIKNLWDKADGCHNTELTTETKLKASIIQNWCYKAEGFHTIQEQSCRLPYFVLINKAEGFYSTELMRQSWRLPYYRADKTKLMASIIHNWFYNAEVFHNTELMRQSWSLP